MPRKLTYKTPLQYNKMPKPAGKWAGHTTRCPRDPFSHRASQVATARKLDLFVRAGWPDAFRLTFKLDQAVR